MSRFKNEKARVGEGGVESSSLRRKKGLLETSYDTYGRQRAAAAGPAADVARFRREAIEYGMREYVLSSDEQEQLL
jgi:hypothetical protein